MFVDKDFKTDSMRNAKNIFSNFFKNMLYICQQN